MHAHGEFGTFAAHMAQHIVTMGFIAPAAALVLDRFGAWRRKVQDAGLLWGATGFQAALLWGWHSPPAFAAALSHPFLMISMHASLFGAAVLFWSSAVALTRCRAPQAIAALLITGKLSCLLGALLIFAPRALFEVQTGDGALADQQLAGLLMVTACPLTYVFAALIVSAQWLFGNERAENNFVLDKPR